MSTQDTGLGELPNIGGPLQPVTVPGGVDSGAASNAGGYFPSRYFTSNYFAPRYFPQGQTASGGGADSGSVDEDRLESQQQRRQRRG